MNRLLEFFQENSGRMSNMRLNSTLVVLAGILAPYVLGLTLESAGYSVTLITLGLGGKYIQKKVENGQPQS